MRKKSELYSEEQKDICDEIIDIISLDEENSVYLYDLDNDIDKTQKIMDLLPKIRTFYSFSGIVGAREPDKVKRPWLSLIKNITKKYYNMQSNVTKIIRYDKSIWTSRYIFMKI